MKEEKKAKKRDDRVAQTIRQFLEDERYSHLFQLISRMAARDCPSIFILAILSLIHIPSREAVEEYIAEQRMILDVPETPGNFHAESDGLSVEMRQEILFWISRISLVMSTDTERILSKLMIDESNIDGTVLQLTTFVLMDFFENTGVPIPFEQLQPLTVKVLQDVIAPHMKIMEEYFLKKNAEQESGKEDDSDDE